MTQDMKLRKTKFKLKIPYQMVPQHTGNAEPEGCSLHCKDMSFFYYVCNYFVKWSDYQGVKPEQLHAIL